MAQSVDPDFTQKQMPEVILVTPGDVGPDPRGEIGQISGPGTGGAGGAADQAVVSSALSGNNETAPIDNPSYDGLKN
jgi:hypothetical protein